MSTRTYNSDAERLVVQARYARAAFIGGYLARAFAPLAKAYAAVRQGLEARAQYRALASLDRHTLVDVGLDHMVPDFAPRKPANENRPRHVA